MHALHVPLRCGAQPYESQHLLPCLLDDVFQEIMRVYHPGTILILSTHSGETWADDVCSCFAG